MICEKIYKELLFNIIRYAIIDSLSLLTSYYTDLDIGVDANDYF